ncbi:MAG: Xaa-Pro peptidase family protein [Candidatus Limnocylindrales bacterium]|jgi:Xaa-Pro aminopeptidase
MTEPNPRSPVDRYAERLAACRAAVKERGFGALLIGVGPDLRYLTGFVGEPMERVTLLVVPREGPVRFLVPRLEASKATAAPLVAAGAAEVVTFEETDDAAARVPELLGQATAAPNAAIREPIGLSDRLWSMHVLGLQRALPGRRFESAGTVMRDLRQVKDADEARLLRLAAQAADRTVDAVAAGRLVGRTEADISRETRSRLIDEGHDIADFAIVGSGPNGASPHHDAGSRVIRGGEPVVLDIGGTLAGYLSDTTRTIWVAGEDGIEPEPEFRRVYNLVREAAVTATEAVHPGIPAERIDAAARAVITAGGYGEYFTHRVGHGIGLEVHEDPYMVSGNTTPLGPGMAFSVEPGIYLPGRWGVRLENIVMCTEAGSEVLNRSSLDLRVVRG